MSTEPWELGAPPDWVAANDDVPLPEPPMREVAATRRPQAPLPYQWPEIQPFDHVDLPLFPVDVLSPWQREWVRAEAEFTQTPVDLSAVLCLASASLAVSRAVNVEVCDGWVEPTNVWVVCGALPGERKSPVFDAATKPIFAYQLQCQQLAAPKVAAYQSDKKILEAKLAKAQKAASENKLYGNCDARKAAADLAEEIAGLKEEAAPVLLADDVTAEAVAQVMSTTGERLGIFSAEGGLFEVMSGRYTESGSNIEIWLKAHSGDSHTVHRIKREPIFLKRPLLTMAITTQPEVIQGLAAKEGFRGKGLLARFLYCMPKSLMGTRISNAPRVPEQARTMYGSQMISMLSNLSQPRKIGLSRGATEARIAFQDAIELRLGPDGDLRAIADWGGKLVGLVARIAGVLHVSDHSGVLNLPPDDTGETGLPSEIPLATWLRAEQIGRYALAHAANAFAVMGADAAETLSRRIWAWVLRGQRGTFTARDAKRSVNTSQEEADAALGRLEARGLIRQLPRDPSVKVGRPESPTWETNPIALEYRAREGVEN